MGKFLLLFLGAIIVSAPRLSADQLVFSNGDKLTGNVVSITEGNVQFESPHFGAVTIQRAALAEIISEQSEAKKIEEAIVQEKTELEHWNGELSAGFDRQRGNTNSTEISAEGEVKREGEKTEIKFKGKLYYASENRKMDEQKKYGLGRFEYKFGEEKRWFNFYQVEIDTDRFANIDYRIIPATGFGYWFVRTDKAKLVVDAGIGWGKTEFKDGTEEESELTVTPHLFAEVVVVKDIKASEDFKIYPSLTSGEYRWVSESKLDIPIVEAISTQFRLINEYNSMPGGETKKNDVRIVSSIAYKF